MSTSLGLILLVIAMTTSRQHQVEAVVADPTNITLEANGLYNGTRYKLDIIDGVYQIRVDHDFEVICDMPSYEASGPNFRFRFFDGRDGHLAAYLLFGKREPNLRHNGRRERAKVWYNDEVGGGTMQCLVQYDFNAHDSVRATFRYNIFAYDGPQPGEDQFSIAPFVVRGKHPNIRQPGSQPRRDIGEYSLAPHNETFYTQSGNLFWLKCATKGYTPPNTNVTIYQLVTSDGFSSWYQVSTGINSAVFAVESTDNSTQGRYSCKAWAPSEGRRVFLDDERIFTINVSGRFVQRQYNIRRFKIRATFGATHYTPRSNRKTRDVQVPAGHQFRMACSSKGDPKPQLTLYHNGNVVATVSNKRTLFYNGTADNSTAGEYRCGAWLPPKGLDLYTLVERTRTLTVTYVKAMPPPKKLYGIRKFVVQVQVEVKQGKKKWTRARRTKEGKLHHYHVRSGQTYRLVCASRGRPVPYLEITTPKLLKRTFQERVLRTRPGRAALSHPQNYWCEAWAPPNMIAWYPKKIKYLFLNVT